MAVGVAAGRLPPQLIWHALTVALPLATPSGKPSSTRCRTGNARPCAGPPQVGVRALLLTCWQKDGIDTRANERGEVAPGFGVSGGEDGSESGQREANLG
jgi:hypothetical protein